MCDVNERTVSKIKEECMSGMRRVEALEVAVFQLAGWRHDCVQCEVGRADWSNEKIHT